MMGGGVSLIEDEVSDAAILPLGLGLQYGRFVLPVVLMPQIRFCAQALP